MIAPTQGASRSGDRPGLLVVDEVGYLSYDNRHADLLFEVVTRRHHEKPTIITPTKPSPNGVRSFPMPPVW
jgi:DNA replication protein DnaC